MTKTTSSGLMKIIHLFKKGNLDTYCGYFEPIYEEVGYIYHKDVRKADLKRKNLCPECKELHAKET